MFRIHFRGFISILLSLAFLVGALHRAMPEAMASVRGEH